MITLDEWIEKHVDIQIHGHVIPFIDEHKQIECNHIVESELFFITCIDCDCKAGEIGEQIEDLTEVHDLILDHVKKYHSNEISDLNEYTKYLALWERIKNQMFQEIIKENHLEDE